MRLAIYSCNGFSREVMPIARSYVQHFNTPDIVWVDDNPSLAGTLVNGLPVLTFAELTSLDHSDRAVSVAIADPASRRRVVAKCEDAGLRFATVQAPEHIQYDKNSVGEGTILCANTMITSNVTIGRHFHLNIYSYVAHDCVIGDFVTFAPGVRCNGRVHIEDDVYVGTNAIFKQGSEDRPLRIGRGAIIGAGSVVLKDVPPGETFIGNPARQKMKVVA